MMLRHFELPDAQTSIEQLSTHLSFFGKPRSVLIDYKDKSLVVDFESLKESDKSLDVHPEQTVRENPITPIDPAGTPYHTLQNGIVYLQSLELVPTQILVKTKVLFFSWLGMVVQDTFMGLPVWEVAEYSNVTGVIAGSYSHLNPVLGIKHSVCFKIGE